MKQNILELEKRRKIYNFILEYPGLHIREISRRIDIPFSTLYYHLNFLRKRGILKARSEGRYNRYYVTNKIGNREKNILNLLRQDTPRAIILLLLAYVGCSQTEISENLEKDPATISFHLKKLESIDVVERVTVSNGLIHKESISLVIKRAKLGNESIYMLKYPDVIYDLLVIYQDNLFDKINVNLVIDYMNRFLSDGVPQEIQSPKSSIDSIAKVIFRLFPPPFCA